MRTLLIVANHQVARSMGCAAATLNHQRHHDTRFWWPTLSIRDTLQGHRFDLVVCDPDARQYLSRENWQILRALLCRSDTMTVGL